MKRHSVVLVLPLILFCACATTKKHYYYLQSPHVVPLFKHEHELRLSGSLNFGPSTNGHQGDAAFSITDKFACMLSAMKFMNTKSENINGVSTGKWTGNYVDAGFGYYKPQKFGVFEIYAGAGLGQQHHFYSEVSESWTSFLFVPIRNATATPIGTADMNYTKFYVQPSYGVCFEGFELALSTRVSFLNFGQSNIEVKYGTTSYNQIERMKKNGNYTLFEPCATLRVGWKYIKFKMQVGSTLLLDSDFPIDNRFFDIGLQLALGQKEKAIIN